MHIFSGLIKILRRQKHEKIMFISCLCPIKKKYEDWKNVKIIPVKKCIFEGGPSPLTKLLIAWILFTASRLLHRLTLLVDSLHPQFPTTERDSAFVSTSSSSLILASRSLGRFSGQQLFTRPLLLVSSP